MIVSSGRCKRQNYILNQKSLARLQHEFFFFKSLFMSTNGYSIFNISYCFQRYPNCVDNIQSFMLRITFVEKGQNSNSQTYPFCYPYNRSPRTTEASCYKGYFTCTNNLNGGVVKLFWFSIYYIDFWCFNATFNKISAISVLVVEEAGVPR